MDICRRAAEIAEAEGKFVLVNMTHVNEALNLMITQPKVQAIRRCSFLEQLILQSIVGEVSTILICLMAFLPFINLHVKKIF